ncbi:MAG TPA: hypothetical protein VN176_07435 [Verrucomicrobiae bacterium]|jgi:hypothetical protein|nr:hypothetical protein [Verrucomicrobiae bacterium]
MLADDIQQGFPDGTQVPQDLRLLCEFAEANDGAVSGCFEFERDGRKAALAWFVGDESAASQFAVFGCGPDGSLYALWLHPGTDISRAPVVLLDSESSGNKVVATDFREFLRLLALGYDDPGRFPTLEPEDPDSAEALRSWLSEEFELTPPASAAELVAAAQRQHPDLAAWVRQWQEKR